MATLPLFGSLLDLPIFAGNYSGCERELVELLKEIDSVVAHEQMQLITELQDVRALCEVQREEIENLQIALQSNGKKIPTTASTKSHDRESKIAAKCQNQIQNLKAESYSHQGQSKNEEFCANISSAKSRNNDLKKQIISVLLTIPCEELRRMNIDEVVVSLQEQVQTLQTELEKKKQEKDLLQKQHKHLSTLVKKLKDVIEKQQRETSPLERFPTLGKQIEEMLVAAFKKSVTEDLADVKKIEDSFQDDVIAWADDLTNTK